jgi:hypothetical protein
MGNMHELTIVFAFLCIENQLEISASKPIMHGSGVLFPILDQVFKIFGTQRWVNAL